MQIYVPEKIAGIYNTSTAEQNNLAAVNQYSHLADNPSQGNYGGSYSGGTGYGGSNSPSESAGGPGSGAGGSTSGGGNNGGGNAGSSGYNGSACGGCGSGAGGGSTGSSGDSSGRGGGTGSGSGSLNGGGGTNTMGGGNGSDSLGGPSVSTNGNGNSGQVSSFGLSAFNAAVGAFGDAITSTKDYVTKALSDYQTLQENMKATTVDPATLSKVLGTGTLTPDVVKGLNPTQINNLYNALEQQRILNTLTKTPPTAQPKTPTVTTKTPTTPTTPTSVFGTGYVPSPVGLTKTQQKALGSLYTPQDLARINSAIDIAVEQALRAQTALDAVLPNKGVSVLTSKTGVTTVTADFLDARAAIEQNQAALQAMYNALPSSLSEAVTIAKDYLVNRVNAVRQDPNYATIAALYNDNFNLIGITPTEMTLQERVDLAQAQKTAGVPVTAIPQYDALMSRHIVVGIDEAKLKSLPPNTLSYIPTDIQTAYKVAYNQTAVEGLAKLHDLTRMTPSLTDVTGLGVTISYDPKTISKFSKTDMAALYNYMKQAGFTGVVSYTQATGQFTLGTTRNPNDKNPTSFSVAVNTNRALEPGTKSQARANGVDFSNYVGTEDRLGAVTTPPSINDPRWAAPTPLKNSNLRFARSITTQDIQQMNYDLQKLNLPINQAYDIVAIPHARPATTPAEDKHEIQVALARQEQGIKTALNSTPPKTTAALERLSLISQVKDLVTISSALSNTPLGRSVVDTNIDIALSQLTKTPVQATVADERTAVQKAVDAAFANAKTQVSSDSVPTISVRTTSIPTTALPSIVASLTPTQLAQMSLQVAPRTVRTTTVNKEVVGKVAQVQVTNDVFGILGNLTSVSQNDQASIARATSIALSAVKDAVNKQQDALLDSLIDAQVQQAAEITHITPVQQVAIGTALKENLAPPVETTSAVTPTPTTGTVTPTNTNTQVTITPYTPATPNIVTKTITDVLTNIGVISKTPDIQTTPLIGGDTSGLTPTGGQERGFFCSWLGIGC